MRTADLPQAREPFDFEGALTRARQHVTEAQQQVDRLYEGNVRLQQVIELVGVIATYNMVSRFLVALNVGPEEEG